MNLRPALIAYEEFSGGSAVLLLLRQPRTAGALPRSGAGYGEEKIPSGHRFAGLDSVPAAAEPASCYPWSVLWRATETSGRVRAVISCARAMSQRLGWLAPAAR
jgi:hypothetical protein